jgi:hypothetical protein
MFVASVWAERQVYIADIFTHDVKEQLSYFSGHEEIKILFNKRSFGKSML